jgi:hypothetical protein
MSEHDEFGADWYERWLASERAASTPPYDACTFCGTYLSDEGGRGGVLTYDDGPKLVCRQCWGEIIASADACDAEYDPSPASIGIEFPPDADQDDE